MQTLEPTTKKPTTSTVDWRPPEPSGKVEQMRLIERLGYFLPNESNECLREIASDKTHCNGPRLRELAADADALWRVAEWSKTKLDALCEEHRKSVPAWREPNTEAPEIVYGPGYELVRVDYAVGVERETLGDHCERLLEDAAAKPWHYWLVESREAVYFDWQNTALSIYEHYHPLDESKPALLIDKIVDENRP